MASRNGVFDLSFEGFAGCDPAVAGRIDFAGEAVT
jgi:hypothetical protein